MQARQEAMTVQVARAMAAIAVWISVLATTVMDTKAPRDQPRTPQHRRTRWLVFFAWRCPVWGMVGWRWGGLRGRRIFCGRLWISVRVAGRRSIRGADGIRTRDPHTVSMWVAVAKAAADAGDLDRAAASLDHAGEIAHSITRPEQQASAWVAVAAAAAFGLDLVRAEGISGCSIERFRRPDAGLTQYSRFQRRTHAIAEAMRLADWQIPLQQPIEIVPRVTAEIMTELAVVRRSETL
jgi:hypothetical protein